jgi:ubiquinone/menaquinone biosynthesis C-methylase UbiE
MQLKNSEYIINGGAEGKRRLNVLAEVLYQYTYTLLEADGLLTGKALLDVGCGGGDVSFMAAGMVGEDGSVTAIDFDGVIVGLDKKDAVERGISNVTFNAISAYDIDYKHEFDIAYSRFLLSHLQQPLEVLRKMVKAVKPGGRIIVEDVQFSGHFCYPECQAFADYVTYFTTAARNNGQDAEIGQRLVDIFREAGIKDVGFDVIQPVFNKGAGKGMAYLTLDKIKDTVIGQGIATSGTITRILQELEDFTNNETTIISLPRIWRVWGYNR